MRNIGTGSTTLFAIIKKIFIKKLKIILTTVTKSQSKFHLATHSYPSHKIRLSLNTAPRKQIFTFTVKPTERPLSGGAQDFLQFTQVDSGGGGSIPKGLKCKTKPHPPLCPPDVTLQIAHVQVLSVLTCSF